MSDKPKPGDRVRVSFEGVFQGSSGEWLDVTFERSGGLSVPLRAAVAIEVLPPPEPPEVLAVRECYTAAHGGETIEETAATDSYPVAIRFARSVLVLIDAYKGALEREQTR